MSNKNKNKNKKYPFVSVCTPTFNRRPFYKMLISCFQSQTYPKDRMEWIIIDDGTDKIEDLVIHIPQVKYFKYNEQMTLGKKRNIMHEKAQGQFIVYMDDDDFYPPERVSHAITKLQENPYILIAGSSEMYIFFKHIHKMYQFGPYGPNHATAATFAFRKELLTKTSYQEHAALAEERHFLKDYTIPFVQLDPVKTILVFSHIHNTFDKKELLQQGENPYMKMSNKSIDEFIKDPEIKSFFLDRIDDDLSKYEQGKVEYKPAVVKQITEIKQQRANAIQQQLTQQQITQQQQMNSTNQQTQKILGEQNHLLQVLLRDHIEMKRRLNKMEEQLQQLQK